MMVNGNHQPGTQGKRHGAFGNLMAGAGDNQRFQAKGSVNKFGKGQQLSFSWYGQQHQ